MRICWRERAVSPESAVVLLGWIGRAVHWIKIRMGLEPRVVRRSGRKGKGHGAGRAGSVGWPEDHGPSGSLGRSDGLERVGCSERFDSRLRHAGRGHPATFDEATVSVGRLSMTLRSSSDLPFPYEVTVVVPRVEITERYVDGKLAEVTSAYSSVTIARSPRDFASPEISPERGSPWNRQRAP